MSIYIHQLKYPIYCKIIGVTVKKMESKKYLFIIIHFKDFF